MRGNMHAALGTVIGATAVVSTQNYSAGFIFMGCCILGSLFPDIDLPESRLGHAVKPVSMLLQKMFGHRGFIHTPLNAALLTLIYYLLTRAIEPGAFRIVAFGFLCGFFAHLLQDTFTKGGIMWLFPIRLKVHFTNIGSDSIWCIVITGILCIASFMLLYRVPDISRWLLQV